MRRSMITAVLALAATLALGGAAAGAATLAAPVVGAAQDPANASAYWMDGADGGVFSFGGAPFRGSASDVHLNAPVVGMAATPDGGGYWLVAGDGGVFSYGDAGFFGSAANIKLAKPVVGMAATPDGRGYWLVAADGGVFSYGDAGFHGSGANLHLNAPIVGMAATPDGGGYWLVGADGGVFSYGDAGFYGSAVSAKLSRQIVGMATTPDGRGYWLVGADGGVFSYGDAGFHGSLAGRQLNAPIVAMSATADGGGYRLYASDGGVFALGDAPYSGSLPGLGFRPAPTAPPPTAGAGPVDCASTPGAGDEVTRWTPVIACTLQMHGIPATADNINDVLIIIAHESSGNPSTVNLWDINAREGHPSQGLMQEIISTFIAYRSPALANDILDPAANIYAGIGYAVARYGSLDGVPGVIRVKQGRGYVGYAEELAATGSLPKHLCAPLKTGRQAVALQTTGVGCRAARRVVHAFASRRFQRTRAAARLRRLNRGRLSRRFTLDGYRCQYRRDPAEKGARPRDYEVLCARGRRLIGWTTYAPRAHQHRHR